MPLIIDPTAKQRFNPARLIQVASFALVSTLCVYTIHSHQSQANTTHTQTAPSAPDPLASDEDAEPPPVHAAVSEAAEADAAEPAD